MREAEPYYDERIGKYLKERGLLDDEDLARAKRVTARFRKSGSPRSLADVIRDLLLVPSEDLEKAIRYSSTPTEKMAAVPEAAVPAAGIPVRLGTDLLESRTIAEELSQMAAPASPGAPAQAAGPEEPKTDILKVDGGESPTDMLPAPRAGEAGPPGPPPGYKLLARIGTGAMGTVYKAQQLSTDRVVALKILSDRLSGDKSFIDRFVREARLTASLSHPNIVSAVDVGSSGGKYYYAMEFVEGETVLAVLRREKVLPEKRALQIALEIARALGYAGSRGLIHRDVKPDNILIAKDGTAKLADMGLARPVHHEGGEKPITSHGMVMGTADYMSPEQARGEDLDTRTDIYSLGATLFRMVAGRPPFKAKRRSDVAHKHVTEPAPRADEVNPDVSEGTALVILKAMKKAPERRYQTPGDIASDLADLMRGMSPGIASSLRGVLRQAPTARAAQPVRSHRAAWAVLVAVAAAVAITVGGYLTTQGEPKEAPGLGLYQKLVQRARQSISDGDHDSAINLLEEAARLNDSEEVRALMRSARRGRYLSLGKAAEEKGELASAVELYSKALQIEDDESLREQVSQLQRGLALAEALKAGDRHFEAGEWKGALKAYGKAWELARDEEKREVAEKIAAAKREDAYAAAMAAGRKALEAREWKEAILQGSSALAVKPKDKAAAGLVASAERGRGKEEEDAAYAAAMADGREALEFREWEKAVSSGGAALALRPGDEAALTLIASAERGREEERREAAYAEAMAAGREALGARRWDEAISGGEAALAVRPGDEPATALAAAARRGQEEERKEAVYAEAVKAAGDAALAGEWDKVAKLARSALAARPRGEKARELLAAAERERRLEKRVTNSIGMDFVLVPAGEFTSGSDDGQPDERPAFRVHLDSYYVSRYEVTNAQFERFRPGHSQKWRRYSPEEDMPAVCVTWEDAAAFCEWLTEKEGVQYRLPTEAEWEKSARGTDGRAYPWGDEAPDAHDVYRCNFATGEKKELWGKDRHELAAPVGSFPRHASPFGAQDMAGNVWEWCLDWYAPGHPVSDRNPCGPPSGEKRVLRGGSFTNGPGAVRCANRSAHFPEFCNVNVGFRCVREAESEEEPPEGPSS